MKQSIGRLSSARPSGLMVALAAAAAAAVGMAACGGGNDNTQCHYIAQAEGVIGQPDFTTNTPNGSGIGADTLGGIRGAVANYTVGSESVTLVTDSSNNRILGFNNIAPGIIGDATFVLGQGAFNSNTAGTTATTLSSPSKSWIDPTGTYLVVADTGNSRVLIWTLTPGVPMTAAPTGDPIVIGQPDALSGSANQGLGAASASTLNAPDAAVIVGNTLIVADTGNNRVLLWPNVSGLTSGAAATTVLGQTDFVTNTANTDQFNNATDVYTIHMDDPSDVWTDGSHLLVADSSNHRVLYYSSLPTGSTPDPVATQLLGFTKFGEQSPTGSGGASGFNNPFGVTSDGTNVFVSDTNNNRVLVFKGYLFAATSGKSADYVYGQQNFTNVTDDDPDQNGRVGDQRNDPTTPGVTAGTLFNPQGVTAVSGSNEVFITDSGNSRVLQFTITSNTPTGFTAVDGTDPNDSTHCY